MTKPRPYAFQTIISPEYQRKLEKLQSKTKKETGRNWGVNSEAARLGIDLLYQRTFGKNINLDLKSTV